jgi:hypothetical protein
VTTVVGTAAPTSAGLTGIAVRPADIPEGVWPEHRQLGAAEQLEVAWGDREFYMAPRGTLRLALRAAFWSSASVLHISAFDRPVDQVFSGQEIRDSRFHDAREK